SQEKPTAKRTNGFSFILSPTLGLSRRAASRDENPVRSPQPSGTSRTAAISSAHQYGLPACLPSPPRADRPATAPLPPELPSHQHSSSSESSCAVRCSAR